jgi:hypothetical protein
MGPPEVLEVLEVEEGLLRKGDEGAELWVTEEGGSVSQERVRRQDCRIMEKEDEERGSCEEV